VIVQGPPGTGKTHTIGNLIGHLLAQGKSILVTAQTAKALRVVRDKVPEILRPLAVSVLGSDQDARKHLESAIGSITERLTGDSAEGLLDRARRVRV
jgi:DNA polymerase III delta prime subunit